MLIYISFSCWSLIFSFIILFFNCCFFSNFSLSSNILSLLNRIHLNDFYLNNLYFIWTSLWYIPVYIVTILVLLSFKSYIMSFKQKTFSIIFLIILVTIYMSYHNSNLVYTHVTYLPVDVNVLLSNSVNKIHPLLLYFSLLTFPVVLFNFYNSNVTFYQRNFLILATNICLIKNKVVVSIFTLFLGSWWALQEGSWGGWWNWDFSEVFGIFILLKLLTYFHVKYYQNSYINNWFYIFTSVSFIFLFYLSIQLNFSYVSHNFGFRFYKFINSSIFFNYMLVIIVTTLMSLNLNLKTFIINATMNCNQNFLRLSDIILIFSLACLYLSLFILINDFLWNNFNVNLFNFQHNFNYLILILVIIITPVLFKLKLHVILFLFSYISLLPSLLFLALKRLSTINFVLILHYSFIFIFMYSLLYFNESSNCLIILESSEIFKNYSLVSDLVFINTSSNVLQNSTTFDSKHFELFLGGSSLTQEFYPLGWKSLFVLRVDESLTLFILFSFLIIFYSIVYKTNQLIMFK